MDQASLGLTYDRHRRGLYALALSITRCPQNAEDAVHEAFTKLCSRPLVTQGDEVAYVFASVRNAAIEQQRKPARPEPASLFNGHAPDPVAESERAERDRRLRHAVDALPVDQREAVVLRIYAGLSFEQIAQAVQAPLPTVAARYRRALDKLRLACGENP